MLGRSGGSLLLFGAILIIAGFLMKSGIIDFLGWVLIVLGIIGAAVGIFQLFSGNGKRRSY